MNNYKKYYTFLSLLVIIVLGTWYTFSKTPNSKKIVIAYNGDTYKTINPDYKKNIKIELDGNYDKKTEKYIGKLAINEKKYNYCMLSSGFGVICYDQNIRIRLGQIYADSSFNRFTIEIEDYQTILDLTKELNQQKENLIISYPSNSRDQTMILYNSLQNDYYDKVEKSSK
ncbi:hypothetical protein [Paenibacillus sp. KN14-4R]|uniref:hypothetical protein n=1 Tax=Paenibacillus sp. KN14-4R TaxID=3445773 RepID=UPI003FA0DE3C